MQNYEIVIETCADLSKELRHRYHIHDDYIRNVIYFPNNVEVLSSLEWDNYTLSEYYNLIKKYQGKIKTAFATYEEFIRVVEPILKEGKDVIIPVISSGISGTYQAFKNYAEMLLENYPDRKIEIIDSLKYSSAIGLLAVYMAINKDNDMSFVDNVNWVNKYKYYLHEIGPMDDLRFLAKNGRISASKAFFGQLVGVEPIADFTLDGKSQPLGTIKGEKAVFETVSKYFDETARDVNDQIVFICHSLRPQRADKLREIILSKYSPKEIHVIHVGQSCGANIGPGLACIFYFGVALTSDRSKENAAFIKASSK